jgi:hypothetical protein
VAVDTIEFNMLLLFGTAAASDTTEENYLKTSALLSYPENYLKFFTQLERPITLYMRFQAPLQAEAGRYLKVISTLQREVFPHIKFAVAFPAPTERYLKVASAMQAIDEMYIRFAAQFAMNAEYLKVHATLVKEPIIGESGNSPPANKVGLLSRHYLSVASVKKEV